ncbi:MAG: hypothetical protein SW833_27125 [Cyanobacteriota bacterium]|nr:hypothetical protein [Cyanobacteriota bacterium]
MSRLNDWILNLLLDERIRFDSVAIASFSPQLEPMLPYSDNKVSTQTLSSLERTGMIDWLYSVSK